MRFELARLGHQIDLQETFIDGSFAPAKQGGAGVGKTKRGKGSKIMAIADRRGLPVAVHVETATPHEVTLVHATSRSGLSSRSLCVSSVITPTSRTAWMPTWPAVAGTDRPAPQNANVEDPRRSPPACYRRRWKIERLFAWFQNFRRLVVRYERYAENFLATPHLACCLILWRGL